MTTRTSTINATKYLGKKFKKLVENPKPITASDILHVVQTTKNGHYVEELKEIHTNSGENKDQEEVSYNLLRTFVLNNRPYDDKRLQGFQLMPYIWCNDEIHKTYMLWGDKDELKSYFKAFIPINNKQGHNHVLVQIDDGPIQFAVDKFVQYAKHQYKNTTGKTIVFGDDDLKSMTPSNVEFETVDMGTYYQTIINKKKD